MKLFTKTHSVTGHCLGWALLLILFAPTGIPAMYIAAPILTLVFFVLKKRGEISFNSLGVLLASLIFLSLVLNSCFYGVGIKAMSRDILLFASFLFFPLVKNESVPLRYIYISICILCGSQLIYLFNIHQLFPLMDLLYPTEDVLYSSERVAYLADSSSIFGARIGGIFKNPNQFGRAVTFLFTLFLLEGRSQPLLMKCLVGGYVLFSVLATGSRTALGVCLLLVIGEFLLRDSRKLGRWFICFIVGVGVVGAIVYVAQAYSLRSVDVVDGMSSSLGVKISILTQYLSTLDFGGLLLGRADSYAFTLSNLSLGLPDSEYGELIVNFGFLFFIVLIIFFIRLFIQTSHENKLFFVIFLWMLTSTLMMNYRISILFFLFLAKYTSPSKGKQKEGINNQSQCQSYEYSKIRFKMR